MEGDAVEEPQRGADLAPELLERSEVAGESGIDEERHLRLLLAGLLQVADGGGRGLDRTPARQDEAGEAAYLPAAARERTEVQGLDELAQVAVAAGERCGFDGFHAAAMLDDEPQGCRAEKT